MIFLVLLLLGGAVNGQQLPCGSTPIPQSRVIGGQDAKPGAWPWQIQLKRSGSFICGGSLISADWAVTAAHCVARSSNPSSYKVVVGDHNRYANEGTEEEVGVKRVISHPNYNNPRLSSDIALLQLSKPVTLSQRVNPICLPNHDSDVPTGSTCYITGWGKIKHPGSSHNILQQAMMPPIDNTKCRQKIQASNVGISLTPQMLCAGVENTILSGCHGDSGGPYVCLNADKKTYTLHGAVSWGSGSCNARQLFTVFARVTQFRAWIKQNTGLGGGGGGGTPAPPTPPPPSTPPLPSTPSPSPGNVVFSCSFDQDLCGFTQSQSDTFDWKQNSGGTPSYSTGPSSDHSSGNGKYMYIETSSPRVQGDDAKLEKSSLSFSTKKCLTFYYHMYGNTMGTLNVYVGSKKIFTKSGDQGNKWYKASVDIDQQPGASTLVFEGIRGSSYTGDAAIDDVELKECGGTPAPPTPPPPSTPPRPSTPSPSPGNVVFNCRFDKDLCGFIQLKNDKFDWKQNSGGTPSFDTGPSADHSGKGKYMYIETSLPRVQGDNAKLEKRSLSFSTKKCLTFYYHMYGNTMGTLNVYVGSKKIFTKSGDQGNKWNKALVDIDQQLGASTLVFEGVRGSSYTGDAAIDDVELKECGSPPVTTTSPGCPGGSTTQPPVTTGSPIQPFKCNFDKDMCNFLQGNGDDFDWTRKSGRTTSSGTGPSGDHTTGNGYYMYTETSSPRVPGEKALLSSPPLDFNGKMCLCFFYHMYGGGMGTLNVLINGKSYFTKFGNQGNKWENACVEINSVTGKQKVTFQGIRGSSFESDMAIDDFSLTPGSCLGVTTMPPTTIPGTPPPPGSCGVGPNTRIVGGVAAKHGDWPWQAQLRTTSGFPYCGGSLVHPSWIVTATHCVSGKSPSSIVIRLGAHRRVNTVGTEQDIRVSKVITHPSYHRPLRYSHDIALLKLEKPALLNRHVNLVCLPQAVPAPTDGARCYITGWGRLSSGGATPDYLQQVSVPVTSRARCDKSYPGKIHDSMICAGLDQGGIDSCQGDSGGPMACETGGKYYLQGATSWGYGCASAGKFGVYAKVKYVLNWLNGEMAKN